jgi:drug/metabolite transporter (DMT)-like permease
MKNNIKNNNTTLAIKYMLLSSFLFAFTGGFAKELSAYMSSVEVVFFRNISGVIIILYAIYKKPLQQTGGKFLLLFMRGLIGFAALLMYFYNIAHIPLAEALTFNKISPIFTALFSYLLLKEQLSKLAWSGVFVGFIGVLFITGFDIANLSKTDWLGIFSGIGAGLAYTSIRELRKYYDNRAIVLSFMLVGSIGPIILMIVGSFINIPSLDWIISPFIIPQNIAWVYIIGLGGFATLSQIYMTKAYSLAAGGIVGTISYSNIAFAIIVGSILGDSFPSLYVIFGIILIVLSGILVTYNKS